jgi:sugar phosphate isomerase/epimerase
MENKMNITFKKKTSNGDSYDILLDDITLFYQPWQQFPDVEHLEIRDKACEYMRDTIAIAEKLKEENEKLKACVEFYEDIDNIVCVHGGILEEVDLDGIDSSKWGKLARKTLSELKPSEAMEKE